MFVFTTADLDLYKSFHLFQPFCSSQRRQTSAENLSDESTHNRCASLAVTLGLS
jgi:hypothetical protein